MSHGSFTPEKDWDGDSLAVVHSVPVSSQFLWYAGFHPGFYLGGTEPREGEEMR